MRINKKCTFTINDLRSLLDESTKHRRGGLDDITAEEFISALETLAGSKFNSLTDMLNSMNRNDPGYPFW
jgi:hypothetical protein